MKLNDLVSFVRFSLNGSPLVQITVPKGDVTFRLVASGYRDKPDKIS